MRYFINLLLLGLIVLFEDKRNENQIFVHINKIQLPNNYLQIVLNDFVSRPGIGNIIKYKYTDLHFNINDNIIKCNFINSYKNNFIKTKKIKFLNCNSKGAIFTLSQCYKNYKHSVICRYKITPSIAYKCFPSNKCDLNLFHNISGLIYM